MELLKDKHSRSGLIGTILFHALVLIIFLLYGLKTPVPLPDNSIVINFGTSNDGMGNVQPDDITAAPKTSPQVEQQVTKPVDPTPVTNNSEAVTQDNVDAISVNEKKAKTKTPEPEPVKEPEKVVNQKAMFPGKTTGKNSGSEGETGKPGDQGDPGGDKNSTSHQGDYRGGGDSYSLGLRKAQNRPKPKYDCQETGKVVVTIKVDQNGNTIDAQAGARGTTNMAACLLTKAEEAARKTKWEPDPSAPEVQQGSIVYNFVLN
jgi:periplasmic protein TonB